MCPGTFRKELQTYIDEQWALLTLDGEEDPDILDTADKEKLAVMERAASQARHFFSLELLANHLVLVHRALPDSRLGAAGPG